MLTLLLLSIVIMAGFFWLKSMMDELNGQLQGRLDTIEKKIDQLSTEVEKR